MARLNGNESKIHESLLKRKTKIRPTDHEFRQKLERHSVRTAPMAVSAACCLTQNGA